MDSPTSSSSTSSGNSLVEQFCSITGSSRDEAYETLEDCRWDLSTALNMHLNVKSENENASDRRDSEIGDGLRSPIPRTRGILVEEYLSSYYELRSGRRRKRMYHSVFDDEDPFQEIYFENSWEPHRKRRKLDQPPLDLMFNGTFESARDLGESSNRWLMVNIQNSEHLDCQVLNSDVWSESSVKNLIDKNFVFWQVYHDSPRGRRYMQFYNPVEFPYMAVIDPKTGEKLVVWHNTEASTICDLIDEFLKEYPSPNGDVYDISAGDNSIGDRLNSDSAETSDEDVERYSESLDSDSESEDAISEYNFSSSDLSSDASNFENISISKIKEDVKTDENWLDFLGPENDPKIELILSFPDGNRTQITWPCTTKIKALLLYIGELGYGSEDYELIAGYPRKNLSDLDLLKTLEEADLINRELINVYHK